MRSIKSIAVIGLGYVGLPLALLAEEKGFSVIGIDLSKEKLDSLKEKKPIIDDEQANHRLKKTKILFSDDFNNIKDVDAAIICVPTPVDADKNPDISLVENAAIAAAKQLKPGCLLVVESTINPGVCDEIVIPAIEKNTKHKVGKSLFVAHCPERINPGDTKWSVDNINRVLGADSEEGLELAFDMYNNLIDANIKKMNTLMEAEACKVVENSFRDVNIAFVNELAMSFEKLGINVKNVIDGAATKPFAFMAHYPGIGVGGHCIPVDPYYLIEYARNKGFDHKFLSLAREINESMPNHAIDSLEETLLIGKDKIPLNKATVTVMGVSYKPDVGDDRESPAYEIIKILKKKGARVIAYDPYMPNKSDVKNLKDSIAQSNAAILVTGHNEFIKLGAKDFEGLSVLIDGRNIYNNQAKELEALGVIYRGIGTR